MKRSGRRSENSDRTVGRFLLTGSSNVLLVSCGSCEEDGPAAEACALLGVNASALSTNRELLGQMLETFVFQELRRAAGWQEEGIRFDHFRDRDGVEVDIVLERSDNKMAGVEVKASSTVRASDFRGLRKLKEASGKRFAGGVVLYNGETSAGFGDGMYAVSIRSLWEGS